MAAQFNAKVLTVIPPSSLDEIEAYLASGMIKGVGKTMAKKLVNQFGEQVFEVIEHQPHRLTDIPGLGKQLAQRITEAWEEQRAVKDIMLFLQSRGLSRLRADRISKPMEPRRSRRSRKIPISSPEISAASVSWRRTNSPPSLRSPRTVRFDWLLAFATSWKTPWAKAMSASRAPG